MDAHTTPENQINGASHANLAKQVKRIGVGWPRRLHRSRPDARPGSVSSEILKYVDKPSGLK